MTTIAATIGTTYTGTGGSAIAGVVGNWTRSLLLYDLGAIAYAQQSGAQALPLGDYQMATSRAAGITRELVVQSTTTATTAGTDARETAALTEWLALQAVFQPYDGLQYLKFARDETGGGTRSSVMIGEVVSLPGARVGDPGVGDRWLTGNIRYPVQMWCPLPWFWSATEVTDDTTEVGASAGTATVDVATDAACKCGAKLLLQSVTGTITKLRFQNTTTGDEFTVQVNTGFATNDYIDFYHVDKLGRTDKLAGVADATARFTENASLEAWASFWLQPGANSVSVSRITGTGTATVRVVHQPFYGSI